MSSAGYSFVADGLVWQCRPTMPEELWHDYELLLARGHHNKRNRAIAGTLGWRILAHVVVDAEGLLKRAHKNPDLAHRLHYEVLPDLLNHYEKVR